MSICSICKKPVLDDYTTFHFKCYEETMSLMIKDDMDYKYEQENKPVREIKKKLIKPVQPIKQFKQPKPIQTNSKVKKALKIIVEKEYFPLIQVSYDPNDTTIFI